MHLRLFYAIKTYLLTYLGPGCRLSGQNGARAHRGRVRRLRCRYAAVDVATGALAVRPGVIDSACTTGLLQQLGGPGVGDGRRDARHRAVAALLAVRVSGQLAATAPTADPRNSSTLRHRNRRGLDAAQPVQAQGRNRKGSPLSPVYSRFSFNTAFPRGWPH